MSQQRHHSFAAIFGPETQLLILGSLPGARSLAAGQYYAHPQNQFWRLLEQVTGLPLVKAEYPKRLALLRQNHIGLWDVIESAARRSSLDSDITQAAPQDLHAVIQRLPLLRAIAFNGGKAAQLGRRILNNNILDSKGAGLIIGSPSDWASPAPMGQGTSPRPLHLIDLPSSSAANTQGFADKAAAWSALAPYVGGA